MRPVLVTTQRPYPHPKINNFAELQYIYFFCFLSRVLPTSHARRRVQPSLDTQQLEHMSKTHNFRQRRPPPSRMTHTPLPPDLQHSLEKSGSAAGCCSQLSQTAPVTKRSQCTACSMLLAVPSSLPARIRFRSTSNPSHCSTPIVAGRKRAVCSLAEVWCPADVIPKNKHERLRRERLGLWGIRRRRFVLAAFWIWRQHWRLRCCTKRVWSSAC